MTNYQTEQNRISTLRLKTRSGYSYDRYGISGWNGAIKVLINERLSDEQIEAFLLSKHMRWAGDADNKRKYGTCNGQTVKEYLANETKQQLTDLVNELLEE